VSDGPLICIVEIPKGSRNKYEFDHETHAIKLDRFLFSSVVYPTDYGFFPDTLSQDGDPLDAMVCVSEPTFPGCVIEVKPIALFRMEDEAGIDDKVLCVPVRDPGWNTLNVLEDLPTQLKDEIAHFFSIYKDLEQKAVKVDGWYPREEALEEIEASRRRFSEGTEH
jgi:inorganic pyrophosphatase